MKTHPKSPEKVPTDKRFALRVLIKSLSAEALIIRKEERRTSSLWQYQSLHEHRINVVRRKAREALIALGFIREKPYYTVESVQGGLEKKNPLTMTQIEEIARLVASYGAIGLYPGKAATTNLIGRVLKWVQEPAPERPKRVVREKIPYTGPKGPTPPVLP